MPPRNDPSDQSFRNEALEVPFEGEKSASSSTSDLSSTSSVLDHSSSIPEPNLKPANKYFRWNLLFTFLILGALSFPFWFPLVPIVNRATLEVILGILISFQLVWASASYHAIKTVLRLRRHRKVAEKERDVESMAGISGVKHLVGLCMYKEPLNLMKSTLDSLARQTKAGDSVSVVVGLEERTPDREKKAEDLMEKYQEQFERFIVTVHPSNVPGELPGKASNFNYCSREAISLLRSDPKYRMEEHDIIVTTGDCDTIFPEDYLETLEIDYISLSKRERLRTVWQSPLFYQMGIEHSPFFVRVTGLLRSFFMMGILIPWNINTMSVFSLSLNLYETGGYTHPSYQMDDIIAMIRWSLKTKKFCGIRMLPVATISGPTSGKNYRQEFMEWARQIERWTIGAAEVFHYFMIKSRRISAGASVSWAAKFIAYYGLILCVAPIFSLTAPFGALGVMRLYDQPMNGLLIPNTHVFDLILLGLVALQYFWFALVFWLNWAAAATFPDEIRDKTNVLRGFVHWLMSLPVVLGYCSVELWGFLLLTVRGKAVCQHKPSKKDALSSIAVVK